MNRSGFHEGTEHQQIQPLRHRVVSLLDDITESFNSLGVVPRHGAADSVLLALLSKLIRVARAVVALCDAGYVDEAFGLCRTAVEIGLSIRWLSNRDTENRCRRYKDYSTKNYVDLDKQYRLHIAETGTAPAQKIAEMTVKAKDYKEHQWIPAGEKEGGIRSLAYEQSTTEIDDQGEAATERLQYDIVYRLMSYFTHGTIGCLVAHHLSEEGEVFWIAQGRVASRQEYLALLTGALSAWASVNRILRYFNYKLPKILVDRELDFGVDPIGEQQ